MTKKFCDWCRVQIYLADNYSINLGWRKDFTESHVGLQAPGEEEICYGCFKQISDLILKIKESND